MAPIKSSLAKSVGKLLGVAKDTDLSLRGQVQSNRQVTDFSSSGGTKSTDGDYTYHYFTTSTPAPERSFTLSGANRECDVICVAGGGGGSGGFGSGGYGGGGGGAGGVTMNRVTLVDGTSYTVTIGDGGTAGPVSAMGGDGGDSTFGPGSPFPFLSKGGGGGTANYVTGNDGGSGGGAGANPSGIASGGPMVEGTVPTGGVRLGTMGGRSCNPTDPFMAGGGGGATSSGGPGHDTWPLYPRTSTGGRGLGRTLGWNYLPTGFADSGDFAGGGAGAGWSDTGPGTEPAEIAAYEGGGTARRGSPLQLAGAGTANSGGGGGGGSSPGTPADAQKGAAGGSGFVIVKYKTSDTTVYPAPSSRTFADVSGPGSNHTEITNSGRQYNIFTGPGTLTVNSSGEVYYLVVAGGASGSGNGGGGGAGGVRTNDPAAPMLFNRGVPFTLSSPQTITVGDGGSPGSYPYAGDNGGDSSIGSLVVADGGGRGGSEGGPSPFGTNGGHAGGCGGGGGYPDGAGATASLAPTSPDPGVNTSRFQGFPGNFSEVPGHYGGGGGSGYSGAHQDGEIEGPPGIGGDAAGFPGFPAPVLAPAIPTAGPSPNPNRTAWTNAVTASGYFAGGGAGGDQNGGPDHPGGRGGGGRGGIVGGNSAESGVPFTGSGGGGSGGGGGVSGAGANGIVIIVTEV